LHRSKKGILVAIEGIDGSGKTTVAKKLVERLRNLGYNAEYTYEPYVSYFSEAFKKYIEEYGVAEPEIETLAMALDRAFHVRKVIAPLLMKGYIVVTDRYLYSSYAYQGARGVDIEWIKIVNKYAIEPDVSIYLRVPLEIAIARKRAVEPRWSYFEDIDRLVKVQEIYEQLVKDGLLLVVDATQTVERVVEDCLEIVLARVNHE